MACLGAARAEKQDCVFKVRLKTFASTVLSWVYGCNWVELIPNRVQASPVLLERVEGPPHTAYTGSNGASNFGASEFFGDCR